MPKDDRHLEPTLPPGEPAIGQLRDLPAYELDFRVQSWLLDQDLHSPRFIEHRRQHRTYQAWLGRYPFAVPIYVRVFQRRHHVQGHEIDAIIGLLSRQQVPLGLVVTTGGFSREARAIATATTHIKLRLLTGSEWARDLAERELGVEVKPVRGWLLNLACQGRKRHRRTPKRTP